MTNAPKEMGTLTSVVFDRLADRHDAWFDMAEGRAISRVAASAGFEFAGAISTLPMGHGQDLKDIPVPEGATESCGFAAMLFRLKHKAISRTPCLL